MIEKEVHPVPEEKGGKSRKKYLMVFTILIVLLFFFIGDYFLNFSGLWKGEVLTCGDGSFYDSCSSRKPYFCENGILIEKASVCGCSEILIIDGDSCISKYQNNSRNITLNYILRGEEGEINFIVYEGMVDYILNLPTSIRYSGDQQPSRADFKLRNINEEEQRELLLPLVTEIQNLANDKVEQARIATSLVQHIQYGFTNRTIILSGSVEVNYTRYPYEVLYEGQGICGEKSELLAFLLKEIGYGVAFFYHIPENHESIGIKCPVEYSINGTGYCFIETTGPSIITDDSIEYVGGIILESKPEVIFISEGISLPGGMYEYKDARNMKKIRQGGFLLFEKYKLEKFKEKYGLVDEYNPG